MNRKIQQIQWLVLIGTLHLFSTSTWAQSAGRLADEDGGTLQWLMAAGLLVLVCAPAALNAKRSHQY